MKATFKNLYLDYNDTFKELQKYAKKKPIRASLYGCASIFILNLFRANEGLRSYNSDVVSACNRMYAVTEGSRNPTSYKFIQELAELNFSNRLRQVDLGFATLVYKADANPDVALYRYNCQHLKPTWREFITERVVDFGMLGRWLMLETKMINYDINEDEYAEFEKL